MKNLKNATLLWFTACAYSPQVITGECPLILPTDGGDAGRYWEVTSDASQTEAQPPTNITGGNPNDDSGCPSGRWCGNVTCCGSAGDVCIGVLCCAPVGCAGRCGLADDGCGNSCPPCPGTDWCDVNNICRSCVALGAPCERGFTICCAGQCQNGTCS